MKVSFTVTVELCDEEIKEGDLFFFYQNDGLPTIRRAKGKEDWNDWAISNTGENPYRKIVAIKGVLISPKEVFKNLTSFI